MHTFTYSLQFQPSMVRPFLRVVIGCDTAVFFKSFLRLHNLKRIPLNVPLGAAAGLDTRNGIVDLTGRVLALETTCSVKHTRLGGRDHFSSCVKWFCTQPQATLLSKRMIYKINFNTLHTSFFRTRNLLPSITILARRTFSSPLQTTSNNLPAFCSVLPD